MNHPDDHRPRFNTPASAHPAAAAAPPRQKNASALEEVQICALPPESVAAVLKQNAGIDILVADSMADPVNTTIWLAHGPINSLFISVAPDEVGGPLVLRMQICWGGTEWDRKQALRRALEAVAKNAAEQNMTVRRL